MAIKWNNPKHDTVPDTYPCLMLLKSRRIEYGMFHAGLDVLAWTVMNPPDWLGIDENGKRKVDASRRRSIYDDN